MTSPNNMWSSLSEDTDDIVPQVRSGEDDDSIRIKGVVAPISNSVEDEVTLGPEWLTTSKKSGSLHSSGGSPSGGHSRLSSSLGHGSSGGGSYRHKSHHHHHHHHDGYSRNTDPSERRLHQSVEDEPVLEKDFQKASHFYTRAEIVEQHKASPVLPVGFNGLAFVASEESLQPMFKLSDHRLNHSSWSHQHRWGSGRGRGRGRGRNTHSRWNRNDRDDHHHHHHHNQWGSRNNESDRDRRNDRWGGHGHSHGYSRDGGHDRWNNRNADHRGNRSGSRWDSHSNRYQSGSNRDYGGGPDARLSSSGGNSHHGNRNNNNNQAPRRSNVAEWLYMDPQDQVHGPFTSSKMTGWWKAGHFPDDLRVRHVKESEYCTLDKLVKVCGTGQSPFTREVAEMVAGAPGLTSPAATKKKKSPSAGDQKEGEKSSSPSAAVPAADSKKTSAMNKAASTKNQNKGDVVAASAHQVTTEVQPPQGQKSEGQAPKSAVEAMTKTQSQDTASGSTGITVNVAAAATPSQPSSQQQQPKPRQPSSLPQHQPSTTQSGGVAAGHGQQQAATPVWPKSPMELQRISQELQNAINTLQARGYQAQQQVYQAHDDASRQYYANALESMREEYTRLQAQLQQVLEQWSQMQSQNPGQQQQQQSSSSSMAHGAAVSKGPSAMAGYGGRSGVPQGQVHAGAPSAFHQRNMDSYQAAIAAWQQQPQNASGPTNPASSGHVSNAAPGGVSAGSNFHHHQGAAWDGSQQRQAGYSTAPGTQGSSGHQANAVAGGVAGTRNGASWQVHTPPRVAPLRTIQMQQQLHPSPEIKQSPQVDRTMPPSSPSPWQIPSPSDVSPSAGADLLNIQKEQASMLSGPSGGKGVPLKMRDPNAEKGGSGAGPTTGLAATTLEDAGPWKKNLKKKKPRKTKAQKEKERAEELAAAEARAAEEERLYELRVQEAARAQKLADEEADRLAGEAYKRQVQAESARIRRERANMNAGDTFSPANSQQQQQQRNKGKSRKGNQAKGSGRVKSLREIQEEELREQRKQEALAQKEAEAHRRALAEQAAEATHTGAKGSAGGVWGSRSTRQPSFLEIQAEEERRVREQMAQQAKQQGGASRSMNQNTPAVGGPWSAAARSGGSSQQQQAPLSLREIQNQQRVVEAQQQKRVGGQSSSWSNVVGGGQNESLPSAWAAPSSNTTSKKGAATPPKSQSKSNVVAGTGKPGVKKDASGNKGNESDFFWNMEDSPSANKTGGSNPTTTASPTASTGGRRRRRRRGGQKNWVDETSTPTQSFTQDTKPSSGGLKKKVSFPPEFERWVHSNMRTLSGGNDGSALLAFLSDMENLSDVREILVAHLGTSPACSQFIKNFCENWKLLIAGDPLNLPSRSGTPSIPNTSSLAKTTAPSSTGNTPQEAGSGRRRRRKNRRSK